MHCDILIIGGGLAGLSAARQITRNNSVKVILMESGKSTKNNPTRLTFKDTIDKYELTEAILRTYRGFAIRTVNGYESLHEFDQDQLVALDYLKACNIYLNELASRNNFKLLKSRAEKFLMNGDDRIEVYTNDNKKIQCDLLIDASGKKHFSLSKLGLVKPQLYSHSYGYMFKNCDHSNVDLAYFIAASKAFGSGGGWYYPIDKDRASVGFAVVNSEVRFPSKQLQENFSKAIKNFKPFSEYLKNASPIRNESGTIPVEHMDKIVFDRIMIVGDAAGQATPWMCMGVEPVLISGEFAGKIAELSVEKQIFTEDFLFQYQTLWNNLFKKSYDAIKFQKEKIWFLPDEVWDFLIECDVSSLSSVEMLGRMKMNSHLIKKFSALSKWALFKIKNSIFNKSN